MKPAQIPDPCDSDSRPGDPLARAARAEGLEPPAVREARHVRMLQELAEIGMDIAQALRRRVLAEAEAGETDPAAKPAPSPPSYDPGLAFGRVARAVRQCLALEARLAETGWERATQKEAERLGAVGDSHIMALLRVEELREQVEKQIDRIADDAEADRLLRDLDERLGDFDQDEADELNQAPLSALIARICADLGLEPDWRVWAGEPWAQTEAQVRPAGSPYAPRGARRRLMAAALADAEDEDDEPISAPARGRWGPGP